MKTYAKKTIDDEIVIVKSVTAFANSQKLRILFFLASEFKLKVPSAQCEHTAMAHSPFNEQIKFKTASMHAISVLLSLVRIKIETVHEQATVFPRVFVHSLFSSMKRSRNVMLPRAPVLPHPAFYFVKFPVFISIFHRCLSVVGECNASSAVSQLEPCLRHMLTWNLELPIAKSDFERWPQLL